MKKAVSRNLYIQGNLVNHLTVGKHQRLLERASLRNTRMQIVCVKIGKNWSQRTRLDPS